MFILRNGKNKAKGAESPGTAFPGDVLISGDKRKSYLVDDSGSHRKLEGEEHLKAMRFFDSEMAEIGKRRKRQDAIAQAELAKLYGGD